METYEKTGYVRWESILHFYSIDCVKAGFLRKQGGRWYLTKEGEDARLLPARELIDQATRSYREWRSREGEANSEVLPTETLVHDEATKKVDPAYVLEDAESKAASEIEAFVKSLGPYEFQDLVAALIRALGYATPHVPKKAQTAGPISSRIQTR